MTYIPRFTSGRPSGVMRSIADHGLLPPRQANGKGLSPITSFTPIESETYLCGREVAFDPSADKSHFKTALAYALYDFTSGILSVMSETNSKDEVKDIFEPRPIFGIIFAAQSSKLRPDNSSGESIVHRGISMDEINYILVPSLVLEEARSAFHPFAEKLVSVPGEKTVDYKYLRFSRIPDFETRIEEILKKHAGIKFWLHGARLPLPEALKASPPTLSITDRFMLLMHDLITTLNAQDPFYKKI